jgi:hypothetical protein
VLQHLAGGCYLGAGERVAMSTAESSVHAEISALEERLRIAELGPEPHVFEELLDCELLIVAEDGQMHFAKSKIVEAHQPGKAPKFTEVNMNDVLILDHGGAAVVVCTGTFVGPQGTFTRKFMRVWVRKADGWKIVAGSFSQ